MLGPYPGALVSCACAAWIWVTLVVLDRRRNTPSPETDPHVRVANRYVRMLATLAALDFADGAAYILALAKGSRAMCVTQGMLFVTVEPAIFVWTACMACELWFVVVGPFATASEAQLRTSLMSDAAGGGGGVLPLATGKHGLTEAAAARRHRIYKVVTALVPAVVLAVVLLGWGTQPFGRDEYGQDWCWITPEFASLEMGTYYAVFVLAFAVICGIYVRLGLFLRSGTRVLGAGRQRRLLRMAVFPVLFALVWVWDFVEHVYLWEDRPVPAVVSLLSGAATSMSGVANALAYGLKNPRVAQVWRELLCSSAPASSALSASSAGRPSVVELRDSSSTAAE